MASQNKSAKTYGNLQAGEIADPTLMRQYLIDSAGLVQVSETDTHVKRLDDALVAGTGIVKTKLGSGADETLQLAVGTHTHSAADITSGTLDNARVNWAAPSAIGGTTAVAATFTNITSTTVYNNLISGTTRAVYVRNDGVFGYLSSLPNNPSTGINIYFQNTNTNVTLNANTNDVNIGLSITFTPNTTKVMMLFYAHGHSEGWSGTEGPNQINFAYKVGTGAITYFTQKQIGGLSYVVQEVTGLTAGTSVTISFFARNTWPELYHRTMNTARVLIWEKAN